MLQQTDRFRRILARNIALPLVLGVLSAAIFLGLITYLVQANGAVEEADRSITRAYALQKLDLDMESALRGFLLTGDERFFDPFRIATAQLPAARALLAETLKLPVQQERLQRINAIQDQWDAYALQQAELKRRDKGYAPGDRVAEGLRLKAVIRSEFDDLVDAERRRRIDRVQEANRTTFWLGSAFVVLMLSVGGLLAWRGRHELLALSDLFQRALEAQERQGEVLQAQAWLREGQARLGEALGREQQAEAAGHAALDFLAGYAGCVAGAVYVPQLGGGLRRIAAWGPPSVERQPGELADGRTLVAECAAGRRLLRVEPVPAGALEVASGLVQAPVASLLVAPVQHEGRLVAVLELGFLQPPAARVEELLATIGGTLGASLEAALYRRRLQDVLEETQQLNEELQVQQEELRTANEELEEQSRALREQQAQLENQQAELEQTNQQLSEQAEHLAGQRDALREAQAQLEQRADELQRASRYKSEFLANMSHELRTPLNSALILARLLADNAAGNLDREQVQFAESIYAAGNDLLNLINDILDIAKVEAGKLEVRPEPVAIGSVLQAMRTLFAPQAEAKGLALALEAAPGLPQQLSTDRQRLEQVLKNLLANAVKFTERGSVELRVEPDGPGQLRFVVRDTGIGIDPSQHELIFEAFRQADGTASRKFGGTGLGLSISRDLARLLGGDLTVDSVPGQGSRFTLVLPLQAPAAGTARARPAPAPLPWRQAAPVAATPRPTQAPAGPAFPDDRDTPADAGTRTVLVVEDDPVFARILYDLAHELGYRCLVAHHAEEGLALAGTQQPQAVLLDMRLPDGTGLAVLQRLKDQPATRHIPVHVLSVEDQSETALQLGAIGYETKPASREQLREVFGRLERKLAQTIKRVLVVEDDARQRESVARLIGEQDVEITAVGTGAEALAALGAAVYDCMVMDLTLPDMSGQELLRRMAAGESRSFPPVVVYTGRNLSHDEEAELLRYSRSIIIKGARSPERLLDEVTLFLHQVESRLSGERQRMLRTARNREKAFEGRRILVVDDDVRNIFALTSALEHKGAEVVAARHGAEALRKLQSEPDIDLVLMDLMMPEMDGYTAIREIRRNPAWRKLPIVAVTAKAMKEDQERCLQAGANDYLAKPIELERLFSLLRVWMPKLERL